MIAFRTTGKDDDDSKSCGWGIRAACDIKGLALKFQKYPLFFLLIQEP